MAEGRVRGAPGFTLLEVSVTIAIFGLFLYILIVLTSEMQRQEKRMPVNFMAHPEVGAVLARLRKDVLDATNPYYPAAYDKYSQTPQTLIVYTLKQSGFAETVVYDFSTAGEVHRLAFSAGAQTSEWVARGTPQFTITDFPIDQRPDAVRVQAVDEKGRLAIDQILQPRPH